MRSLSIAILLLGIAATVLRADSDSSAEDSSQKSDTPQSDTTQKSDTSTKSSWMRSRDTWGGHKQAKKQATEDQAKAKAEAQAAKATAADIVRTKAREDANLLRRLAVCDQLRLIASKTNDDTLARHADELDQRARDIYSQRIARLPIHMVVSKSDIEKAKQERGKQ